MKKNQVLTIRPVELNNKSRKGLYIYIRKQGHRAKYFKARKDVPLDIYKQYYLDQAKKKTKGTLRQYEKAITTQDIKTLKVSPQLKRQIRSYLRRVAKRPKIEQSIRKGITSITIDNIHTADNNRIREAYKSTLAPLVLDKKMLELLTLEENLQKIKKRFEYRCNLLDTKGNKIATEIHGKGEKSLREVITDLKESFKVGMEFSEVSNGIKTMKNNGYSNEWGDSQEILKSITIEIVFRRG